MRDLIFGLSDTDTGFLNTRITQLEINEDFPSHDECEAPKVSFVVPVYNMREHIGRCLKSLLSQTLADIEVICVDDASADGTGEIIKAIAKRDKRLKVILYTENSSANQARKDAVLASRGEYILFCDADDTYSLNACEVLYAEMQRQPADILHYNTEVVDCGEYAQGKAWLDKALLPHIGTLRGREILEGCFLKKLFGRSLWNKMYASALAKKAFACVEDGSFPRGQDLYAFTLLAYFAESYRGINSKPFYHYHYGLGGEGSATLSAEQFKKFCTFKKVSDALYQFFEKSGTYEENQTVLYNMRFGLIEDCVNKFCTKVAPQDRGVCFDMLLETWPSWAVADSIARRYWNKEDQAIKLLGDSKMKYVTKKVKVIGMYYHKLVGGGVQRVIQYLTPLFVSMGYRVVLIADEQSAGEDIELPDGVKRYMIPNGGNNNAKEYYKRALQLNRIIHTEGIDVVLYHAWVFSMLTWDMLVAKAAGAAFVVHCHNIFSFMMRKNFSYPAKMPAMYNFADGVVSLSDVDERYWKNFNTNVFQVVNPVFSNIKNVVCSKLTEQNILWVGRISEEKQPEDALKIFEKVYRECPDARLKILGSAIDSAYMKRLNDLAKKLGISGAVEFCGFHDDVAPFYESASVFLSTSSYEGFPLTLFESKSFGVPIVMYELPYLTLTRGNKGIIPVPPGDVDGAADSLVRLLKEKEERLALGKEARAHAVEFSEYDYASVWRSIFNSLADARAEVDAESSESIMWSTLFQHYVAGANYKNAQIAAAKKQ